MNALITSRPGGRRRRERGQVLVIFAGGLLALLAIAAIVIDLGFVFMLRRMEQNVADPAAIAAARYIRANGGIPDVPKMRSVACLYARQNGLFPSAADNSGCVPANDPDATTLTVNYPPSANAGPRLMGRPGYVEVIVSRVHNTFLGTVLGIRQIPVTSSAVAAFHDGDSNSNSLIALDTGGCGGNPAGGVSGGANVTIQATIDPATGLPYDGGYVHVNSSCGSTAMQDGTCGNGEGSGALKIDGNNSALTAPRVYVHGTCVKSNNNSFTAPLFEGAVQIGDPLADLTPPDPADYPTGQCGPTGPMTDPTTSNGLQLQRRRRGPAAAGDVLRWLEDRPVDPAQARAGDVHHGRRRNSPERERVDRLGRLGHWGHCAHHDLQHG